MQTRDVSPGIEISLIKLLQEVCVGTRGREDMGKGGREVWVLGQPCSHPLSYSTLLTPPKSIWYSSHFTDEKAQS